MGYNVYKFDSVSDLVKELKSSSERVISIFEYEGSIVLVTYSDI